MVTTAGVTSEIPSRASAFACVDRPRFIRTASPVMGAAVRSVAAIGPPPELGLGFCQCIRGAAEPPHAQAPHGDVRGRFRAKRYCLMIARILSDISLIACPAG